MTSLIACQSNTPSSDVESSASTIQPAITDGAKPEANVANNTAAPSAVSTVASDDGPETTVETKPVEGSTKTPRPKSSSATAPSDAPKPPASANASPPAAEANETEAPAIEKPCLAKTFEFSSVKAACEKGGVPKAKALMKTWTNKAKEKGENYKCTSCHDNQRTYSNSSNASADLRKLLDVIK